MKATMSITDANDLTVELSVSLPASSLSQIFADGEFETSTSNHAASFLDSLLEMPKALLQAHETVSRNLLASSCDSLNKKVTELREQQNA